MANEQDQTVMNSASTVSTKPSGGTVSAAAVPLDWLRKHSNPKPLRHTAPPKPRPHS
jgi:hypothetical protein